MLAEVDFREHFKSNPVFGLVAATASGMGVKAYVVGGYVRDLFLNRTSKDIDFVCLGSGIALAEKVSEALGGAHISIFKNFGTAMIRSGEYELEFVGARKESYREDSRKPLVEDGTLSDDQNRRDFTINALAVSLNAENFGELIDPFSGLNDLRKKVIKTPLEADRTFSDDPLRMMRAIRFANQLNFDIDPDTFDSIIRNAARLKIISMERIIDETNKIIACPQPSYGFKLLFHGRLLHQYFPEMAALQGVEYVDGNAHKDNFYHTLQVLDNVCKVSDDLWLRWSAILHDIAKPATKRYDPKVGFTFHGHEERGAKMTPGIFRRLKLPMGENMNFVQKLVRLHLRPISLVYNVSDSAIRRLLFEAGEDLDALMILCRADITSKNTEKVTRFLKNFDEVEKRMLEVEEKDGIRNFQPPVSGEEIMQHFGIPPSKMVGIIKDRIKDAILEGEIKNDREEAWRFMLNFAAENGITPVKQTTK
ncbi:MAG: HD domain-containing protein [Bacteroidetes bacterium]|nr:HD domain-containing protein [Bacteroidota bacterium]